MPELRLRFEKLGKAAYLSHLDVLRTFQRAFIRADAAVKHSEGFNPHPKMSIAMPLQLGCESVCEVLDVSLLSGPEDLPGALNAVLPEGLRVLSAGVPRRGVGEIGWTGWALYFDAGAEEAERVLRSGPLVVEKKTKRGLAELDIAPHIRDLEREGETLRLCLSALSPTVNTGDVTRALGLFSAPLPRRCRRLALYTADMEQFL